ncbi:MAG: glycosyltransferase family 4 protein [Pyrinomonadaceae bacterium]
MSKPAIALVVPDLSVYSGVPAVALYLYRIITEAGRHQPELISIATSSNDRNSRRLFSPGTWGGPRSSEEEIRGHFYRHVGASLTELEFQRYRPRRVLTEELRRFDLVQIVAGTPPWTLVAKDFDGPIALQVATLTAVERESILRDTPWPRRAVMLLMTKINTAMEPAALRLADAVFVENDWMYRRLLAEYGPEKVIFAAPGVDVEFFQPGEYQAQGPILSVGRFHDPRKNVSLLLRAYAQLRQVRPDAPKLIMAGEVGPTETDLALAAELGILPHLEIQLAVSLDQLRELYRSASMFVLSSNEEGLGIVILEAMACGIPVVSTRCGGPETSVVEGETGFLTPLNNAAAMSQRMNELLSDASLGRRMGVNGRTRAVARFSLEATGRIYLEKYDELLSGRERPGPAGDRS